MKGSGLFIIIFCVFLFIGVGLFLINESNVKEDKLAIYKKELLDVCKNKGIVILAEKIKIEQNYVKFNFVEEKDIIKLYLNVIEECENINPQ